MTDQTNAELIAEGRRRDREVLGKPGILSQLADALEASEKRAEELKRILNNMRHLATVYGKGWDEERDRAEAAERERDNWKLSAEEAERAEKRWKDRADEAERSRNAVGDGYRAQVTKTAEAVHELWAVAKERDQLAAVVERALERLHPEDEMVRPILASAPADALREVKAEVWDEGNAAGWNTHADAITGAHNVRRNPYRAREEQP